MTFKIKTLSLAVCSALASTMATGAWAQEAESDTDNGEPVEVIEVKGIRGQIASAQELKRMADTVKDVITSTDIGSLPDKSVTEALQRVPGVTIERFESNEDSNHFSSEGAGVVVRGLKRIRSEINGRDSFSASRTGGGLSFADIPGDLLGRIEVVKNTTADLIAGGVAGTINLVTRKPFDADKQLIFAQVKGSYGDHREKWTPSATFLFSDVWETNAGKFGFLLSASDSNYEDRGDGVGIDNYFERSATAAEIESFGDSGTALPDYPNDTLFVPASVAIRTADSTRDRTGFSSSVQWESPDETTMVTVEYIKSMAERGWNERVVQYGEQPHIYNPNSTVVVDANFDDAGFMTSGETYTPFLNPATRINRVESDIDDVSVHLTYQPNDSLRFDADYQHISSTNKVVDRTYSTRMEPSMASWYASDGITRPAERVINTGVAWDLTGSLPDNINYTGDTLNPQFPENVYLKSKMDYEEDNEAESDSIALDIEYTLADGWVSKIKTGLYASHKTQIARESDWNWQSLSSPWAASPFATSQLYRPDLFETFTFNQSDFFGGGVLNGDQSFYFPRLNDVLNYHEFGDSISDVAGSPPDLRDRPGAVGSFLPSEITDTTEDRLELYVQADYEFFNTPLPVSGNIGLRYVSWQVESTGSMRFPAPLGWDPNGSAAIVAEYFPEETAYANGAYGDAMTVEGDKFTRVLPSFNMNIEMSEEHVLRLALSENVYFPIFDNFKNYQFMYISRTYDYDAGPDDVPVTDVSFGGSTGNPMIKPEKAFNIDLTLEWYFSETGSFNVSLFRKVIRDIIRKRLYTEEVTNPTAGITMPVDFQTFTNEGSGTISGFELAYTQFYDFLPEPFDGLGLSLNYTYISQSDVNDSEGFGEGSLGLGGRNAFRAFKNLDLPGYSDNTANLALIYEKDNISARLAYSWRDDYLLTRRDADMYAPVIAKATGSLDGSFTYTVNDNFQIGIEASNLTDEVIKTELMYEQNGRQTPRSYFKTDRRFGVFVKANF